METVINLLRSMQGGSLKKELYDAGVAVSVSAFVQQRDKIPWTVMEEIFENFKFKCKDTKNYNGYRVLAADGTAINMVRNTEYTAIKQGHDVETFPFFIQ